MSMSMLLSYLLTIPVLGTIIVSSLGSYRVLKENLYLKLVSIMLTIIIILYYINSENMFAILSDCDLQNSLFTLKTKFVNFKNELFFDLQSNYQVWVLGINNSLEYISSI